MKPDESTRLQQEELDIKCLQLLRAMIHNEIVKLPDNWEENPHKYKKYVLVAVGPLTFSDILANVTSALERFS